MKEDILYHFSLSTSTHDLPAMFGDVKVSSRALTLGACPPVSGTSCDPLAEGRGGRAQGHEGIGVVDFPQLSLSKGRN